MSKSILVIDTPNTCGDCPLCIYTAEEKRYIGYCNTSDEDYYCRVLERFMEYDKVDDGLDILGKPIDCPLHEESEDKWMKIYLCNPEKYEECGKTLCQKQCFKTFYKEYAKLDENGEPIVVGDTGEITMEFYAED